MDVTYTTSATATGDGRNGKSETQDCLLSAAGYAACFHSALKLVGQSECPCSNATRGNVDVALAVA